MNDGRSACPRNGSVGEPDHEEAGERRTARAAATAISRVRPAVVAAAARRAAPCSPGARGGREYRTSPRAGVTVSATTAEAITARP